MVAILALALAAALAPISTTEPLTADFAVYHPASDGLARARDIARELQLREGVHGTSVRVQERPAEGLIPTAQMLRLFGRGLQAGDEQRIAGSKRMTSFSLVAQHDEGYAALRTLHLAALRLARATAGFVVDLNTLETFTPDEFERRRLLDWKGGVPRASKQYVVHVYRDGELDREISLGMAKLGLPDLIVEGAPQSLAGPLLNVLVLTAQELAEGRRPDASGRLELDIESLRDPQERAQLSSDLKPGAKKRGSVVLREGVRQEGDPENRLLELDFGQSPGRESRQVELVLQLFGGAERLVRVSGNEADIQAASRRAHDRLMAQVKPRFLKGLPERDRLSVKAPFVEGNQHEWMWVEVLGWKGGELRGILANKPSMVHAVHHGDRVTVREDEIFDYILTHADGSTEGNETGPMLEAAGR